MKSSHALLLSILACTPLFAADPQESDYYTITTFETPKETALEVGSIELLPDHKFALGTRRGEIWTVANAEGDPAQVKYQLFASGQHEVLGLAYRRRTRLLYVTNRYEVTRLKDVDGDGRADIFETVSDKWDINGDYHEYAFGSRFDKNGNIWVTLCLTGSFNSNSKFRGWAGMTPDGKFVPDDQRRPLARRRRLQCGRRRLLHRQPGPLERRVHPEAPDARHLRRPSRRLQMVPECAEHGTRAPSSRTTSPAW